jgi:anti-sigma B factor antagonist
MCNHPPDFTVTIGRSRDTVTVTPAGELDLATAPLVADHLEALGGSDVGHLVVDLAGVTFLDSNGVALLIGTWRRAAREDWTLTIANTPPTALGVFDVCGLLDVLPFDGAV